MQPYRRRATGYGVLLLAYQVFGVMGVRYIPPITLALVALQVAIYLRLFALPWYKSSEICISAYSVWYKKDYRRLFYSAFEHGDDWHLYYNMVSFILKGQALERLFGSVKFLYLTVMFTFMTNVTLVGLSVFASEFDHDYVNQCAVGFSGVIFALKVLTTYYYPNYTHQIMGIPVLIPANYVVWVELLLIQLLVPNVSFLGHLAGILVGLAYVRGPLGPILDAVYSLLVSFFGSPPRQFIPRAEATGFRSEARSFSAYVPQGMSEEDQLRRAREASMRDNFPPHIPSSVSSSSNLYPDLDEIRTRRLHHFQR